jgi:hypothetical protein
VACKPSPSVAAFGFSPHHERCRRVDHAYRRTLTQTGMPLGTPWRLTIPSYALAMARLNHPSRLSAALLGKVINSGACKGHCGALTREWRTMGLTHFGLVRTRFFNATSLQPWSVRRVQGLYGYAQSEQRSIVSLITRGSLPCRRPNLSAWLSLLRRIGSLGRRGSRRTTDILYGVGIEQPRRGLS